MAKGTPLFKAITNKESLDFRYLIDSFGSYERLDYGTGHELNFFVFLYCMCKLGFYNYDDYKCLINKIFQRYLLLMRKI